jgi:hypothetical protein
MHACTHTYEQEASGSALFSCVSVMHMHKRAYAYVRTVSIWKRIVQLRVSDAHA